MNWPANRPREGVGTPAAKNPKDPRPVLCSETGCAQNEPFGRPPVDADIHVIRYSVAKGIPMDYIAKAYGVAVGTIHSIIWGRSWTHIPKDGIRDQ